MSALSADEKVVKLETNAPQLVRDFEVAASNTIYKGAMVCLNASGKAVPAADAANLSAVVGVALNHANAGEKVACEVGCFLVANDSLTVANTDKIVMVKDDNTVKATGTNSVKAGIFRGIDAGTSQAIIEVGTIGY